MAGLIHLSMEWNGPIQHLWMEWSVQVLVLVSFGLQVLLLIFAGMRRSKIPKVGRFLLWLVYLMADSTAIYTIGHMSSTTCRLPEHLQLMAFSAPFLLVHLGGQDTITAYAMEDNNLWLRHLLTLIIQSLGVAYILYKHIAGTERVMEIAILMFAVGVLKYGERVLALRSASLDSISKFLDGVNVKSKAGPSPIGTPLASKLSDEEVLQGAHHLLYICMGQFVDYKIWPSEFQSDTIKLFSHKGSMYQLVEMQLSLMYDIFYTKAAVIHTWFGCIRQAISLLATLTALFLFQFRTSKFGYNKFDATFSYILLIGASLLEITSVLRAMGSTWTRASLQTRKCARLHSLISLLRCGKTKTQRRWSGVIGQNNLVDPIFHNSSPDSCMVSTGTKELVLEEIFRIAHACAGKEEEMRNFCGQHSLRNFCNQHRDQHSLAQHAGFFDNLISSTDSELDDTILTWHFATSIFLFFSNTGPHVEATKALSNYMMFLLVERPSMLPSPVRHRLYSSAKEMLLGSFQQNQSSTYMFHKIRNGDYTRIPPVLVLGAEIASRLLSVELERSEVLKVVFGVWVEILCYAAHHCSRDSHASQLSNGGEFLTIVWRLSAVVFDRVYCDEEWFKQRADLFFSSR